MSYDDKNSESSDSLLDEHEALSTLQYSERRQSRRACYAWTAFNVVLFAVSLAMLAVAFLKKPSEHDMLRSTAYYSPMWDKITQSTHAKKVDGSLFSSPHASKWRNGVAPSAAVDDEWHKYELIRTFPITAADMRRIGKDPATAVRYPPSYGLGPDAYVAQLDVFHQLHCLNLLRNIAWAEFDRDPERKGKRRYSDLHWIHVSHCTEILRENVVCAASMDLVTFNWRATQDLPFADFDVNHQCRDFDALWRWQEDNALPVEVARNFTRPDGARELPIGEQYYRLFGYEVPTDLHAGEAHEHLFKDPGP